MKTKNYESVEAYFNSLIEKLKELGYYVFIRNSGDHKVIIWSSTNTHWASAPFVENSEEDLKLVCEKLQLTIASVIN